MAEKSPSQTDVSLVVSKGLATSDLCILGVQEIENLKPRRHEGSRSREWRRLLLKSLGRTHTLLSLTKLGGMQLAVMAKKSIVPYLSPLHVCEVPCGVGNIIHNKGGQAALFRIGEATSFLFINAHLAAHAHRVEDRNADVDRVMTELQNLLWFHLRPSSSSSSPRNKRQQHPHAPPSPPQHLAFHPEALVEKVDRMFFLGDLNYRLELPREDIEVPLRRVKNGPSSPIHPPTYLSRTSSSLVCPPTFHPPTHPPTHRPGHPSRGRGAHARVRPAHHRKGQRPRLPRVRPSYPPTHPPTHSTKSPSFLSHPPTLTKNNRLVEPPVSFLPTFKFNKGRDNYDTSPKRRAPAWTDRILYKPCPPPPPSPLPTTAEEEKKEEKEEEEAVVCERYESVPECRHSDHRPVIGVFKVKLVQGKVGGGKKEEEEEKKKEEEVPLYRENEDSDDEEMEEEKIRRRRSNSRLLEEEEEEEETEEEEESGLDGEDSGYEGDESASDEEEEDEDDD